MGIPKQTLALLLAVSLVGGIVGGAVATPLLEQVWDGDDGEDEDGFLSTVKREVVREESAIISVVDTVSPAVVSVIIYKKLGSIFNRTGSFVFDFGLLPPLSQDDGELRPTGGGSGFIVEQDGLIVTNRHVVEDKQATYRVVLNDGREFDAEVKAIDPILDFALLKINASGLPTVQLGDSDGIRIGQTAIAIGNVLSEFSNTVTSGIISGINRRVVAGDGVTSEVIEEAIQTDAAINPGNSGGPLVNLRGEVIGINTAVSQAGQLLGFAIPINATKPLLASFREQGRIVRPWLGVRYLMLNAAIAEQEKLPIKEGAYIAPGRRGEPGIVAESPAAKAGLKERDIIIAVNGQPLNAKRSLSRAIAVFKSGTEIILTVLRDGKEMAIKVTIGELK